MWIFVESDNVFLIDLSALDWGYCQLTPVALASPRVALGRVELGKPKL